MTTTAQADQKKTSTTTGKSRFIETLEEGLKNGSSDFIRFIAEQSEPSTKLNRQRREAFFTTQFSICIERARYFTESFKQTEGEPQVIRMAKAFRNYMENVTIVLDGNDLFAGYAGGKMLCSQLFPELSSTYLDEDAWDLVQRVNVKGTFLCCRAVARAMVKQERGGKIINMSSTSGRLGVARFAAYCASKFAVRGFTQALALELAPYRINVNAICPGLVETERVDHMAAALAPEGVSVEAYREQMVERAASENPLGRIGRVSDVAQVAAFLSSSESDYLTGISITIAGGSVTD